MKPKVIAVSVALALVPGLAAAQAQIYGTLSNFDVFNDTPPATPIYGAELELEGLHSIDVTSTYPSNFNSIDKSEYVSGATFGTRIRYTAYNFNQTGIIEPRPTQNTNGHFCVSIPGCEHFGFAVSSQPSATRFFWLDQGNTRVANVPMSIPTPVWNYLPPPAPNQPAVLQAEIRVPEAEDQGPLLPDSVWVKTFKAEVEGPVNLNDLISGGQLVPQSNVEIETEWELLEGGQAIVHEAEVGENAQAVIRRYEYYKYTGPYSSEHEPTLVFLGGDPPAGTLGDFISANMVAANLAPVPEPETYALLLAGLGLIGLRARRRSAR